MFSGRCRLQPRFRFKADCGLASGVDEPVNLTFGITIVEATYPVASLPAFHVSFPSMSHQKPVTDIRVGDMSYDR